MTIHTDIMTKKQQEMSQFAITTKGNTAGFTLKGESVTVQRSTRRGHKTYRVTVVNPDGIASLADGRNKAFGTEQECRAYAIHLIDSERTNSLKWW